MDLTVIIPAYNEELGIKETINTLLPLVQRREWSIIIVNDGSTDKTGKILSEIKGIEVVTHKKNKGYGGSLKTAIRHARTELVAMYDADGQHSPEDLERLYQRFEDLDMLVGSRGRTSHQNWTRKPGKWVLSKIANYLSGRKIPDLNSGLRIIRRKIILKYLHLMPDSFSFSTTSTIALMNLGFEVDYFPITVKKRIGNSSVKQLKHGSNTLLLILRLIVLFNPLKVFMPVSLILIFSGFVYEIFYGIVLIPGLSLIPGALLLILTGVLIFFFGLLVDQISEMRKHLNSTQ